LQVFLDPLAFSCLANLVQPEKGGNPSVPGTDFIFEKEYRFAWPEDLPDSESGTPVLDDGYLI
jgi:hypothetical protein